MLTPKIINELSTVYNKSTAQEKDVFADTVNEVLKTMPVREAKVEKPTPPKKTEFIEYKQKAKPDKKKLYGVLSDFEISHLCKRGMINPFVEYEYSGAKGNEKISYGMAHYGYTIRASTMYLPVASADTSILDPKNPTMYSIKKEGGGRLELLPGCSVLLVSIETLSVPDGIIVTPYNLSAYLYCGLIIDGVSIRGKYTGRYSMLARNTNKDKSVYVYINEGIVGLEFMRPVCLTK